MKVFYTYLWLREDGTPYYAGKGHGTRAYRKGSPPPERVLIQEFPNEEDAFLAERFLIALYGRKDLGEGRLINMTDGGDGHTNMSPEIRQKISDANRGNKYWLGRKHKAETLVKLRVARRRRAPMPLAARQDIRNRMSGNSYSKGFVHSDITRAKMSLSQKFRRRKEAVC